MQNVHISRLKDCEKPMETGSIYDSNCIPDIADYLGHQHLQQQPQQPSVNQRLSGSGNHTDFAANERSLSSVSSVPSGAYISFTIYYLVFKPHLIHFSNNVQ